MILSEAQLHWMWGVVFGRDFPQSMTAEQAAAALVEEVGYARVEALKEEYDSGKVD